MRAALHRAAKTGNPDRGRDLHDGRRHARHAAPRSGAHASRWCVDELATHAPRLPRLRADRRARRTPLGGRSRVGPSELYGYDAHRSIAFLTDTTGAVTDTYTYDGWGNLVASTGPTVNTRLYTGQEFDADLGLINLRARQYRPSTGRFFTLDPLMGELLKPTSLNRFLYADGDPINLWDPHGQQEDEEELGTLGPAIALQTSATISLGTAATGTAQVATTVVEAVGLSVACALATQASALDPTYTPAAPLSLCRVKHKCYFLDQSINFKGEVICAYECYPPGSGPPTIKNVNITKNNPELTSCPDEPPTPTIN
jgi:RHS repeat-associated protein